MLGVAGGLGRALAIEPFVIRIAFVVLALFSGIGIAFYVAGWLLLADSPTAAPSSTVRRVVGGIVVVIAVRSVFSGDAHLPRAGWALAIVLFGTAVALWRGRTPVDVAPAPPTSIIAPAGSGGSTTHRWDVLTGERGQRPRPPKSILGLMTIGAATVVGATVWLVNGSTDNQGTYAFGWAALVLGAGLVVGTAVGRARWLIVPALVTLLAAMTASALTFANVGLTGRRGDRTEVVGSGNQVATRYRTGIGSFELWLVDFPGDAATSINVGVGHLSVVVPDGARVQVDALVGMGNIDVLGSSSSGYRRALSFDSEEGTRVIKLTLRVGVGAIEVRRASAFEAPVPTIEALPVDGFPGISQSFGDGTILLQDGSIDFGDGRRIEADGTHQITIVGQLPNGSVELDNGAIIRVDGTVVSPGGFVIHRKAAPPVPIPTVLVTTPPMPGPTTTIEATP